MACPRRGLELPGAGHLDPRLSRNCLERAISIRD
jgi:hypothetical protein